METDDAALRDVLNGALGHFWDDPHLHEKRESAEGFIQREGGWLRLQLLESADDLRLYEERLPPSMILGSVASTSLLLLEVLPPSISRNYGGYKASTRTYQI